MRKYIKQMQTHLKNAGYYAGAIDGIVGKQTVEAINTALGLDLQEPQLSLSDRGMNIIKQFEGFSSKPYLDAVGVPTIGYGNTYYPDGKKVTMQDKPITHQEAHALKQAVINKDFVPKVREIIADVPVEVTQSMFDALVSLAYNIGTGALAHSSVVRLLKAGDKDGAANAFMLWNKAGGRELRGLTARRAEERKLFLG